MKKFNFSVLMLLLVAGITTMSCKKESGLPSNPVLNVSVEKMSFEADASEQTIELSSNTDWTVLKQGDDVSWITVTPSEGGAVDIENPLPIKVKVLANDDSEDRECTLRFAHKKGSEMVNVTVIQYAKRTGLQRDSLILVELADATKGYNWKRPWILENPIAGWGGVTLDVYEGEMRLVALDLADNNLQGSLPESMGRLDALKALFITGANLNQELPLWVPGLKNLTQVAFGGCNIYGPIPDSYFDMVQLTKLDLYGNSITGPLSPKFGNLVNIISVLFSSNPLTGPIPSTIGNLKVCSSIQMDGCQLDGNIPAEIADMPELAFIMLAGNNLTGGFENVGNCPKLKTINVTYNKLEGSVPASILNCKDLEQFFISNNMLSGNLPGELGQLAKLETIQARHNNFSGSIPEGWSDPKGALANIVLGWNELTGTVPGFLGEFKHVELQNNKFSGALPVEVTETKSLTTFRVDSNELVMEVPESMFNRPQMQNLGLSANKGLTGSIPKSIAADAGLLTLYLGGCSFSGEIPAEMFGISGLSWAILDNNNFTGELPVTLTNTRTLVKFVVNGNKLNGCIPLVLVNGPMWNGWKPDVNIRPQQGGVTLQNCAE